MFISHYISQKRAAFPWGEHLPWRTAHGLWFVGLLRCRTGGGAPCWGKEAFCWKVLKNLKIYLSLGPEWGKCLRRVFQLLGVWQMVVCFSGTEKSSCSLLFICVIWTHPSWKRIWPVPSPPSAGPFDFDVCCDGSPGSGSQFEAKEDHICSSVDQALSSLTCKDSVRSDWPRRSL